MHLLIAFIGALASLLYALDRFGIDIGWLNPWAWRRRRKWMKQYHASPAFSIENPLEAAALLLTATAKIDGDLTSDEKLVLQEIFEKEFHQEPKAATDLLVSSVHLIGNSREVFDRPHDVLAPCLDSFSDEQKDSVILLLRRVCEVGEKMTDVQIDYVKSIEAVLRPAEKVGQW